MKFEALHIWIISPEPWGVNFLSKHHYAFELAKMGNFITFIETEHTENLLKVAPEHKNIRLLGWKSGKGQRYLPNFISRILQRRESKKIQRLTKHKPDLIWSFDNSRLYQLNALEPGAKCIHHVVDLNQQFQLKQASKTSDLGVCTTRFIQELMIPYQPNTIVMHHGCQLRQVAAWQPHHRNSTVMYLGNLMIPLLDRELVLQAIEDHPEVEFRFVGSFGADNLNNRVPKDSVKFIKQLMEFSNVVLTGAVSQDHLDRELSKADLFIIAYKTEEAEQVANPHKLMELLSTGRAILSNELDSFKDQTDLISMAPNGEEWLVQLSHLLRRIPEINSPEVAHNRQKFALNHTYAKQIARIEKALNDA
jgi:glycosyltransferase involved in cell wall biosynthesis